MSAQATTPSDWPDLPFDGWRETCAALHLYTQIAGKYRLARSPWLNHSWHATLYVDALGLTTSLIPDASGTVEVRFDFTEHRVRAESPGRPAASFALEPMSVAEFHKRFVALIESVGGHANFHGRPNEIADAVPFENDHRPRPYDADAVRRFHRVLVSSSRVFQLFRTGFLGKVSPVHLFWGSFDLAVTRFSGRTAPLHPGGVPGLPDNVTREAYSHEVSSAGFWPGGGPIEEAAFYAYAYPAPAGFDTAAVEPAEAYYSGDAGEFILPYRVVRESSDPQRTLLSFLTSTYEAAARLGAWDRAALDCGLGKPLVPRTIKPA